MKLSRISLAILAILSLVLSLFFLNPMNLTGQVTAETTGNNTAYIAFGWLALGLIFIYFYFKKKREVIEESEIAK